MNTALAIATIALVVAWVLLERRRVGHEFEETFRGRASLSDDDFYGKFYEGSGVSREVIAGVREVLAHELQVDVSRMAPDDDFSRNLRFLLDSDSMMDVALVEGLEKRFGIVISDREAENTKTVNDIIVLVHGKSLVA